MGIAWNGRTELQTYAPKISAWVDWGMNDRVCTCADKGGQGPLRLKHNLNKILYSGIEAADHVYCVYLVK